MEKKSFLLNLIIASTERGFEVFLSIAEEQQQEHGKTAKMSKGCKLLKGSSLALQRDVNLRWFY